MERAKGTDMVADPASAKRVPFGILPSEDVHVGDHIAYFWETDREFDAAVNFLVVGLQAQDHCVVFGHDQANRQVCNVLERRGFRAPQLEAQGRLTVVTAERTADETLARLGRHFEAAVQKGAPLIRLLANLGWNKPGWPDEQEILLLERKVTGAAKQFPAVIVCMYDVQSLPGRIIVHGGFGTHPIAVCGNVMRVNPLHRGK